MTTANKITISRIVMIPPFVAMAILYGNTVKSGAPVEGYRFASAFFFLLSSAGDWLDGWVARKFDQRTKLGSLLDPIADKTLSVTAVITLGLTSWPQHFPLWFVGIVLAKDVLCVAAAFLIKRVAGKVRIKPHWTGKMATIFQMVAIAWLILQLPYLEVPTWIAAFFTVTVGIIYTIDAGVQMRAPITEHPEYPSH